MLNKLIGINEEEVKQIEDLMLVCNIQESELVEFIREQIEDLDCNIWDVNLKSLVFEYIFQKADVSELIGYITIDKNGEVNLSATKKEIEEAMFTVPVDDRNDSWLFLAKYFKISYE